ncbi:MULTISPECIES: hypothetical protein [unclassified Streptomyces]|jgi:hypothetical protein|uniref:Uncharacterized protein n=1 Tax=Streptomyces thermocoprophilus TaxID=78356 RepID=A0ABV5VC94_9ACTN
MAASYGPAFAVGVVVAWRRLRGRLGGDLDGARVRRTYVRLCTAPGVAAAADWAVAAVLLGRLGGVGRGRGAVHGGVRGGGPALRVEELRSVTGLLRRR